MCVCVCVCIYICIYVYVYISVYITSAYMYMYQRVRLRSSHAGLQWHVPCCMHTILVYHCNKQTSNVFLSIQFDTNVSQLLRHVLPWSYDPLPSLGELSWSSLNRLSVCLSCLFWLCIPPVVYGRHVLCLRCLRVTDFRKMIFFPQFFLHSFKKKQMDSRPRKKKTVISPAQPDVGCQLHPTWRTDSWRQSRQLRLPRLWLKSNQQIP